MLPHPQSIIDRLISFQRAVRQSLINSRRSKNLAAVNRATTADTIYEIDTVVEPILDDFCRDWSRTTPLVLIAEGIEDSAGNEGPRTYPEGTDEKDAVLRLIVDPIDGTRGLMYDKRPAWSLAGVAPNKGSTTNLSDIEIAVMTELPTSKMGYADVLWATRGQGAHAVRINLDTAAEQSITINPSKAHTLDHGFAAIAHFFPGTQVLAAQTMEYLVNNLGLAGDVSTALVFDDQYISNGGQFYELAMGHDRFIADLRPIYYRALGKEGLCCHPYDCAAWLVAAEAGVVFTDGLGGILDGPLDVTTPISWAGYANRVLYDKIQPLLKAFLENLGKVSR